MVKTISSIDIGTSKTICLIAQLNSEDKLCIKSASMHESAGILNGNIVNFELAIQSITKAISKAEKIFKKNIDVVTVSISGDMLKSKNITTEMNFFSNEVVSKKSISYLVEKLDKELQDKAKTLIHLIPIDFFIDKNKISNPVNMIGQDLKIDFHTFYADSSKIDNIINCFKKINIHVGDFIFSGYASALAVLTNEEKINGSLVIDIGAGITSFVVIHNNKFIFGNSIPIAGNMITKSLMESLETTSAVAEKVKISNANLFFDDVENEEIIKINIDDEETFKVARTKKKVVNEIIKNKIMGIIEIIFTSLNKKDIVGKIKKIVVTGGTSNVLGIDNYVANITGIETRVGYNNEDFSISGVLNGEKLKKPCYSTSIGLLKYYVNFYRQNNADNYKNDKNNFVNRTIDFLINLFIS
jgi:cell division protein FtsA